MEPSDHLFRREADVIYEDGSTPPVHVSGHASQEELKLIMNLVKPRYFIPIHGEYRQLRRHGELAATMRGNTWLASCSALLTGGPACGPKRAVNSCSQTSAGVSGL